MPWPGHIQQEAWRVIFDNEALNHHYPLYLDILQECFPPDLFRICPYYATPVATTGGISGPDDYLFTIPFVVETRYPPDNPILFLNVNVPDDIAQTSEWEETDKLMRSYMLQMLKLMRIPKLYGISAYGTQVCFYVYDKNTGDISPPEAGADSLVVPRERWDLDLMHEEGRSELLRVAQEIKDMLSCKNAYRRASETLKRAFISQWTGSRLGVLHHVNKDVWEVVDALESGVVPTREEPVLHLNCGVQLVWVEPVEGTSNGGHDARV
ncbi:hypothetical protein P691DRAFT_782208 [Macrolepiota fuliginosa MF-IS2]|uniref:Uncharacterized protein n=1 Tax=Macrolepiota fuliginosa MF-IS2 TaxID=1400762 RepID=A0A9P5XCL3_9AGAR|nr:hypothetical protein P691DRAFT_782208 [Macrolepiota fuliginosa MF-IS2]